jgi:hypothetical protein
VTWHEAALWGLAGGFVVEGLDLYTAVRRHGKWPWRVTGPGPAAGLAGYVVAELVRLLIGGVLAAGAAASSQVSGAVAAMAIGVAAPVMVERLTALIPLPPAAQTVKSSRQESPAPTKGATSCDKESKQFNGQSPGHSVLAERDWKATEGV